PEEFGGMTLIELMTAMMIALLASGILSALARHHFEAESPEEQRIVWWTGYLFIVGSGSLGSLVGLIAAEPVPQVMFGPGIPRGPLWLRLAAISLWMDIQLAVFMNYLRAHKASTVIMGQSIGRSVAFVACALPGIVVWRLGPTATFAANVIASALLLCL